MADHIESIALHAMKEGFRSEALPDVPTVGEFVPGYEASSVWGLGAPRNTPAEIIDKLNKEINAVMAIVVTGGEVKAGDVIAVELPAGKQLSLLSV